MKYKIGQFITIKNTGEVKKVLDYENILGTNIYYMSDISSYSEDQIENSTTEKVFTTQLEIHKEKIHDLIDYQKLVNSMAKWYFKKSPNLVSSTTSQTCRPFLSRFHKWIGLPPL